MATRKGTTILVVASSALVGVALAVAGCTLPRDGSLSQECTATSECDDDNPCTDESCSVSGLCVRSALADHVLPDALQVSADCLRAECVGGALVSIADVTDVPSDDNGCTVDQCGANGPEILPMNPGAACIDGFGDPGSCVADDADPAGVRCEAPCTAATAAVKCDDQNPCTDDTCAVQVGQCVNAPLNGVALGMQVAGDCRQRYCSDGQEVSLVDDNDAPDDGNACTLDACHEGAPSSVPEPVSTPCGNGDHCDGAGSCVECVGDGECPADTFCRDHSCGVNGTCQYQDTVNGMPLPALPQFAGDPKQTAGDCHAYRCDGGGGYLLAVDDTDLPVDADDCTLDVCVGGTPSNPAQPVGTACTGGTCNAAGQCVGCTLDSQCTPDSFCRDYGCAAGACAFSPRNVDGALPAQDQTAGDCSELRCNAAGVVVVVPVDDPPIDDGNVCTAEVCVAGVPGHPAAPMATPCAQGGGVVCDGAGSCVACNTSADCGDPTCECRVCVAHACANAASGAVAACQTPYDCRRWVCNGNGGKTNPAYNLDLPVDGNQCTLDLCVSGTALNPPASAGTLCDQQGGSTCNGAGSCI